jgi:hypothetical protein
VPDDDTTEAADDAATDATADAPTDAPTEADNTPAATTPADTAVAEPAPPKKMPRWRRALVAVLVVLGCIFAPLSILGVWVHGTLLDTDRYVATVGPLADDPGVQQAVANRVTTAIVENSNVQKRIKDALPSKASFIVPYITSGLQDFVHTAALKVVESDQFSELWKEVNRRTHARVVALLEGKGSDNIDTKNGQIVVKLGPVIDKVQSALKSKGINVFNNLGPAKDREIVLIDSKNLRKAQDLVSVLNKLAWVLPVLTLLFFAAAIWLSPNRRRTILRGALGVALATGLLLIVFNFGRHFYLSALPSSVNQNAAGSVYDQLLSFLRTALRTTFVVALVVALAAWLIGPSKPATRVRTGTLSLVHGHAPEGEPSAVAAFFARYRAALRILVIAIGVAILVITSAPTPLDVIIIAAVVLVLLLLIEFIGRGVTPTTVDSA